MHRFVFALLFFVLLGWNAQAKSCISWSKVFAQEALRKIPSGNEILSVEPFYDDTSVSGDEWLSAGLANLLINYLSTDLTLGVIPESSIPLLPPERPVRYKVGGLFQHTQNWLRIFVQLKNSKGTLLAQFPIETPYPLHTQFFVGPSNAAKGILNKIGHQKIDTKAISAIANETDNVHAYENYIKGEQALESYDPNKIEVALIWFQEARREDSHYPAAFRGLMEAYGFLSLFHKQNGESYAQDLEGLENTWKEMSRRARKTSSAKTNRFLDAQVHFVTGSRGLEKGDALKAVPELEEAARLVPEDSLTAYNLALAYDKLGKTELAGKTRNHAEEINPCLKGQ